MGSSVGMTLKGDLHIYPFGKQTRSSLVVQHFGRLRDTHSTEDILCLTRLCGPQELTDEIRATYNIVAQPAVTSLSNFSADVLQWVSPKLDRLSDHERIELLAEFLADHDWENDYLARAARHETFQQDVGELLIEMESRDALSPEQYDSSVLAEIAEVGDRFSTFLATNEYVDEPSLIPRATEALTTAQSTDDVPRHIRQRDVILVADFEEFAETERRFLRAVSDAADAPIVGVAERESRILSSWREAGNIESFADGLEITTHSPSRKSVNAPQAVGEYLVTGNRPNESALDGDVEVIETGTFREQVTQVADEIERLIRQPEYEYRDILVAFQDSSGPIEETLRLLRRHGIPTTTVAISQLGTDPAVREIYDLTKICADADSAEVGVSSRERLLALEDVSEALVAEVAEMEPAVDGIWRWLMETQLKDRIGTDWEELKARDQYQRVKEVVQLAEFLEERSELDGSWSGLLAALERAFKYSSTRLENIESDRDEGGVPVGSIYGQKHSSSKAVFLLNVTDEDYPFTPDLTSLLPNSRLQEESDYPMLTTQTPEDVSSTFSPTNSTGEDPFHAYFTEVSRRLLGIGAGAATEKLYFGVPRESTDSLGTYNQPSRFLSDVIEEFDLIEPLATEGDSQYWSHGGASEFVVERVDETLEEVRRASVGGDSVDLDAYERELAAIQSVIDNPEAATVAEALEARIDFRQGRVRRD